MGALGAVALLFLPEERPVDFLDEAFELESTRAGGGLTVRERIRTSFLPSTMPRLDEEVLAESLESRLRVL